MIEKTVKIKVDTNEAVKGVDKLTDSVKDLDKQSENVGGKSLSSIGKNAKESGKGIKGLSANFKALGGAIKATGIGLLVTVLASLAEGISQNERASKFFKTAVEAVSIVTQDFINFILDNAGGVVDFFKAIFEDPLQSIKDLGTAIQDNLVERFNSFLDLLGFVGDAFKKFTEGDFSGALESVKSAGKELLDVGLGIDNVFDKVVDGVSSAVDSISEYGSAVLDTAKKNIQLAKSAEIASAQQALLVEQYDRQAEKLRQTRDNDLISIDDRIKANDKLGNVLKDQEKAMLAEANAILASAQAQANKNNNTENAVALLEAQANKAGVLAQIEGFRSEQLTNENALIKEKNDLINSGIEADATRAQNQKDFDIAREEDELKRLENERANFEAERELEAQRLEAKINEYAVGTQARLDAENEKKDRLQEIDQEITTNADAQNKLRAENEKKAEVFKEQQLKNNYNNLQNILSVGGKKLEKVSQALAVADVARSAFKSVSETVSSTGIANAAATAASPLTFGQPWVTSNTIKAGLSIGSTLASAAKSISSITSGSKTVGGGVASIGGGGGGSASAPPPAFNLVGGSGVNQIQDTVTGGNAPIQAYVVGSQITNQQEVDRAQAESASLG